MLEKELRSHETSGFKLNRRDTQWKCLKLPLRVMYQPDHTNHRLKPKPGRKRKNRRNEGNNKALTQP